jgi:integrase
MGVLVDKQLRDIKKAEENRKALKAKAAKTSLPKRSEAPNTTKPKEKRLHDGDGLYFVHRGASLSWSLRWRKDGKNHEMSLGQYPEVSLAQARNLATDAKRLIATGVSPIEARKQAKALEIYTFSTAAQALIKQKEAEWGNGKHRQQWPNTLAKYVYPVIGETSVQDVTVEHVLEILEPIWRVKTETASRVRSRIEAVLSYAISRGWRSGANPAVWRGHLQNLLPPPSSVAAVNHHPSVPWAELPTVVAKLKESEGMSALCQRFITLNAVRVNEGSGTRWNEIDFKSKVWTIPAERMKARKTKKKIHRVPLSDAALEILEVVGPLKSADDGLVFPGGRPGGQLSDVAVAKALRIAFKGATTHGMRSSFRMWCAENTSYPREVAEAALAHTNRDKTEAAYMRSDLLEARRPLMQDWGAFISNPPSGSNAQMASERTERADNQNGVSVSI